MSTLTAGPLVVAERLLLDPSIFVRAVLKHDPWPLQDAILQSVAANKWTAVKACHASSKTFGAAEAVIWWLMRYAAYGGKVLTTATTGRQVERLMWGEIRKALLMRPIVGLPEPNLKQLNIGPDWYALGLSTDDATSFQGWHGHVLVVIDEAQGMIGQKAEIFDAIEGIAAGGNVVVLMIGNPTIAQGPFYDAFHRDRARWATFTISAFDTPNLAGVTIDDLLRWEAEGNARQLDYAPRPYLFKRRRVLQLYHLWGEGDPRWVSRVLGQFPAGGAGQLIPLALIEAANARPHVQPTIGRLDIGIDVAGPGSNETVVVIRRGRNRLAAKGFGHADARGPVLRWLAPWLSQANGALNIKVDSNGIGHYFAKHLQDQGLRVVPVNVGEKAFRSPEKSRLPDQYYRNLRAQLSWELRERYMDGSLCAGGTLSPQAISQLSSLLYGEDGQGRIVIVSKDELPESPDYADAEMLAFAETGKPLGQMRIPLLVRPGLAPHQ